VKTLEETPTDATHWSTRSMAKATGMSQSGVSRIWRAFGLKPHLRETFKLSPDPFFIEKVRDVVGLYLNPPEAALVLCVDEKTQVQALDRTAPVPPLRPGLPERATHDYVRNGTTNLYAALDMASGKVIADMTDRHRAVEFRKFLNLINRSVPEDLDVHLIIDNVSTHKTPRSIGGCFDTRDSISTSPDLQLVDEHGGAVVRRTHREVAPPGHPSFDQGAEGVHHLLDRSVERRPPPLRLAQERRRDPHDPRRVYPADLRLRTLGLPTKTGVLVLRQARFAGSPFARRRILPSDGDPRLVNGPLRLRHRQPSLVWFAPEHPPHNDGPVFFGAHGCDQVPVLHRGWTVTVLS